MPIITRAPGLVSYNTSAPTGSIIVSGTGTAGKIFPASTLSNPFGDNAAIIRIPGSGRLEQRPFTICASGLVTTGASLTVQPILYGSATAVAFANQLTPGSWTAMATPTAVSSGGAVSLPWFLECELIGDSVSGILSGSMYAEVGVASGFVAKAQLTANLTSVAFGSASGQSSSAANPSVIVTPVSGNEPPAYLALGIAFGTSNAGNSAQLGAAYLYAD